MQNKTFGIDLEKPVIKNIDDYTTYLVALEVAGRPLPEKEEIEQQMYTFREIGSTSHVDPRYTKSEEATTKVAKPIITNEQIYKAFTATLNHHMRSDLKKIKELGGYTNVELHKYRDLLKSLRTYLPSTAAHEEKFIEKIKSRLNEVVTNIKMLDDPNFNEIIDKLVVKITSDFLKQFI